MDSAPSSAEIVRASHRIFSETPRPLQAIQTLRSWICPYEVMIPFVPAGSRVLDIGCGAGLFLGLLARFRDLAIGVGTDSSERSLRIARAMAHANGWDSVLEFRCSDGVEHGESHPVVSMIDVLHHVPPAGQERFFRNAADRVAPGGRLLFKDMSVRFFFRVCNAVHDFIASRQVVHGVAPDSILGWATREGLRLRTARSVVRLWYASSFWVFERPL